MGSGKEGSRDVLALISRNEDCWLRNKKPVSTCPVEKSGGTVMREAMASKYGGSFRAGSRW